MRNITKTISTFIGAIGLGFLAGCSSPAERAEDATISLRKVQNIRAEFQGYFADRFITSDECNSIYKTLSGLNPVENDFSSKLSLLDTAFIQFGYTRGTQITIRDTSGKEYPLLIPGRRVEDTPAAKVDSLLGAEITYLRGVIAENRVSTR
ncbi:hypothetical protein J4405_04185 [Candidatus Woesearchaeota archaeon]|nr:hypothetical protein [Candidatus Woesearchaeota archaeon]